MYIYLILLFIVFVAFNTAKQKIYFRPETNCDFYPVDIPDVFIHHDIHAWHSQSTKSNKTILYCHGNAGNIGSRTDILKQWNDQGFSVLMFDYPGYGMSKGSPTEQSFYESGEKCMDYLLTQTNKNNIILYGESIGCSVASHLASKYGSSCVVLQSGFSSIKDVAKHYMPVFLDWLLPFFHEFNTYDNLKKYKGHLMIMHSKEDEIIPYSNAEKLSHHTTNLYEITGSHNRPQFDIKRVSQFMIQSADA